MDTGYLLAADGRPVQAASVARRLHCPSTRYHPGSAEDRNETFTCAWPLLSARKGKGREGRRRPLWRPLSRFTQ